MKKGYMFAILFLLTFFVGKALAEVCIIDGLDSPTGCVCGHYPNSSMGYGQVIIGGSTPTVISCSNYIDGICPEDFTDPVRSINASCSRCPDPDCMGNVWGFVNDTAGRMIEKVNITGHPIIWNDSNINLDKSTLTNSLGKYNYSGFVSGKYYFSASKDAYDSELIEAEVILGQVTRLDFTLNNGTCQRMTSASISSLS